MTDNEREVIEAHKRAAALMGDVGFLDAAGAQYRVSQLAAQEPQNVPDGTNAPTSVNELTSGPLDNAHEMYENIKTSLALIELEIAHIRLWLDR